MTKDSFTNNVEVDSVKGIVGSISGGTVNQYIASNQPEDRIKERDLIKDSPYKGLDKFEAEDKDKFFGRDQLIADLSQDLEQNNLLLLLGASGSGKSSLVRAGLIPKFLDKKFVNLTFVPDEDPFESLYGCLISKYGVAKAKIAQKGEADTLVQLVRELKKDSRWLIFIDQFEELFTISQKAKRDKFIDSLVRLIELKDNSVKIVLTMRADFLDKISPYPSLVSIYNTHSQMLADMSSSDLRLAIAEPAARNGVVFQEGLVEEIINDFQGRAGSLPLLQYTLNLLWEKDDISDRILNTQTYYVLGRVIGALQQQANKVYDELPPPAEQKAARQIFIDLVDVVGGKPVSRRSDKTNFSGDVLEHTLDKLISSRLLVVSKQGKQKPTVAVAHEALLTSWKRLQDWIKEAEETIILKNRLIDDAKNWSDLRTKEPQKAAGDLWSGSKLERVIELREQPSFSNLSKSANQFINASVAERDRLLKQEKERTKRLLTVASITSVVFAGLAIFTGIKGREAQIGQINALSGTSEALLASNQEFDDLNALTNSLQAGKKLNQVFLPEARLRAQVRKTLQTVIYGVKERDRLEQDKGQLISGLSADGRQLANLEQYGFDCSWDNLVCLWDKSGEQMTKFLEPQHSLKKITFSPDGSKLIIASDKVSADGSTWHDSPLTLRLWDLKSKKQLAEFKGRTADVWSVSFSPDGSKIAIAGDEGIRLWDKNGKQIPEFKGGQGRVTRVIFSPDGTKLAAVIDSTSSKGYVNVRLWNLKGQQVGQLKGDLIVDEVIFSPDGTQLATTGSYRTVESGTVRLWDLSGNQVGQVKGAIGDVIFSPDGSLLAGSGKDGIPGVWDLSGEQLFEFQGHQGWASSVNWSPDGRQLVTTGRDNTIRLWDLNSKEVAKFKESRQTFMIVFSPDGSLVANSGTSYEYDPKNPDPNQFPEIGRDNAISLWDLQGKKLGEVPTLQGNRGVTNIAISPDNQQLALLEGDRIARLWNWKNKQKLEEFKEPQGSLIIGASFSGDRSLLVTKGEDSTIRLWNWKGKEVAQFKDPQKQVNEVILSPDGSKIVTAGNEGLRLWNLDGKQIAQVKVTLDDEYNDNKVILSRNDRLVAINGKEGISVWNWDGKQVAQFKGVHAMDVSSDGSLLATNQDLNNVVRLWDLESKQQIAEYPTDGSFAVQFSPNGKLLVTAPRPQLWQVESLDDLMVRGCDWVRNYLENNPKVEDSDKHLCKGIG